MVVNGKTIIEQNEGNAFVHGNKSMGGDGGGGGGLGGSVICQTVVPLH